MKLTFSCFWAICPGPVGLSGLDLVARFWSGGPILQAPHLTLSRPTDVSNSNDYYKMARFVSTTVKDRTEIIAAVSLLMSVSEMGFGLLSLMLELLSW